MRSSYVTLLQLRFPWVRASFFGTKDRIRPAVECHGAFLLGFWNLDTVHVTVNLP